MRRGSGAQAPERGNQTQIAQGSTAWTPRTLKQLGGDPPKDPSSPGPLGRRSPKRPRPGSSGPFGEGGRSPEGPGDDATRADGEKGDARNPLACTTGQCARPPPPQKAAKTATIADDPQEPSAAAPAPSSRECRRTRARSCTTAPAAPTWRPSSCPARARAWQARVGGRDAPSAARKRRSAVGSGTRSEQLAYQNVACQALAHA